MTFEQFDSLCSVKPIKKPELEYESLSLNNIKFKKENIKYSIGSQVLFYILPLSNKLNPKEIFIYSINLANTLQVPIERIFYYKFKFLVRDVRIIYFKTKKDREYSFIYESISEYIFKTRGL